MPDYDADFYGWANEQAALLRAGRLGDADIANIAEEIESMGRSEKRELVSRLVVLLTHLLKWRFQERRRSRSWQLTILEQRRRLQAHLLDNPSLLARVGDAMREAYGLAVLRAENETDLDESVFPTINPWPVEQVLDEAFFPE